MREKSMLLRCQNVQNRGDSDPFQKGSDLRLLLSSMDGWRVKHLVKVCHGGETEEREPMLNRHAVTGRAADLSVTSGYVSIT